MIGKAQIISYRDLEVWQQGMDLADLVYDLTERFPARERYGLALQMRKAAVSIPSNIAEGTRHRTPRYLSRVIIALGEHAELETQDILECVANLFPKRSIKSSSRSPVRLAVLVKVYGAHWKSA